MQKLYIISNESIYKKNNKYFCDNIDLKSTPESLRKYFEVNLIARKSKLRRSHQINLNNINVFKSFFTFVWSIIISAKKENIIYLIISISPYTFFCCLVLKLLGKKPVVYLRSDGFKEYKAILGVIGQIIYFFMFHVVSSIANLISCSKLILREKKGAIVYPSQLDNDWFKNVKDLEIKKFKLLYVGRMRVEKGIFSFLKMIENKNDFRLTIAGEEKDVDHKINQNGIKICKIEKDKNRLIKLYDDHNIFILPSFTEGHPMVLLEALARRRPVIIFEDIKYLKSKKKGVFISKRNFNDFLNTLKYIKKNYKTINRDIKKNVLPTKKKFIESFTNYLINFKINEK